jgi:DNA-binding NtrC family response regulator
MQEQELISKKTAGLKKAFVVGDEARICELVALILESLGFESIQTSQSGWLEEKSDLENPELIVWDLNRGEDLSLVQSLLEMREQVSTQGVKVMLLGGPELKTALEVRKGELHFCLKPFSPKKFRYEIGQLYGKGA